MGGGGGGGKARGAGTAVLMLPGSELSRGGVRITTNKAEASAWGPGRCHTGPALTLSLREDRERSEQSGGAMGEPWELLPRGR